MERAEIADKVARVLFPERTGTFDPARDWGDLGALIEGMEAFGYFLMVNSTSHPELRRVAAFHRVTERGFPCAGSSEWGPFPTLGGAVLAAAGEALFEPRGAGGR